MPMRFELAKRVFLAGHTTPCGPDKIPLANM
jgi:hypothetical protein